MIYALSAGLSAAMVIVQALLTRVLARTKSGAVRGGVLFVKFPLWAGFFIALATWHRTALWVGGLAAAIGYFALAVWWMRRMR